LSARFARLPKPWRAIRKHAAEKESKIIGFMSVSFPDGRAAKKNDQSGERFVLRKKRKRSTIVFVDMEIMRTPTSPFGKLAACACGFFLAASSVLASDIVLQKVPMSTAPASLEAARSQLGPQASFALINYNLKDIQTRAHALYVSSGNDLKVASNMIDNQPSTSFGFSVEDRSPTAVIDLGKVCTLRLLSATYSARAGVVDFYVMQSLPGAKDGNAPDSLTLDSNELASLKSVGAVIDDGTQGRGTVEFPATTGRYVMLKWSPATRADSAFTVAEITATGPSRENLLASNVKFSSNRTTFDSKDVPDSKDVADSKDIPEEAPPAPPAEGPPPTLPNPPPFTFIPQLLPTSD
jgi:hypothetical protein